MRLQFKGNLRGVKYLTSSSSTRATTSCQIEVISLRSGKYPKKICEVLANFDNRSYFDFSFGKDLL